jgi:F-type H+-transporting ATPase subunit b
MTPTKKLILKILAGIYLALIVAFLAQSVLRTQAPAAKVELSERMVGTTLAESLALTSLDNKAATTEVVEALTTAKVSALGTGDAAVTVNPELVGKTLNKPALPKDTVINEALWDRVLAPEKLYREKNGTVGFASIVGVETGVERTLDAKLVGAELTEPLVLESLDGQTATAEVVKGLTSGHVSVMATTNDPAAVVGTSLVGQKFRKPVLPADAAVTEEMWKNVLAAEKQFRETAKEPPVTLYVRGAGNIMNFDLTLVFVVVNFLGLLILLRLFLWEPILGILDKRAETIQGDLDSAATDRREAETLKTTYDRQIVGAKQERQQLVAEGRGEGEAEKQRIVAEAKAEADRVMARSREELAAASAKARTELQKEVGQLSVQVAEQILRREVRAEDNERLVQEFLVKLKSSGIKN